MTDVDESAANVNLEEVRSRQNERGIKSPSEENEVEFLFPFEPYDIQKDFMNALYKTLQEEKMGIFESPTGTGKSLSIICGCLKWLKDEQEKEKNRLSSLLRERGQYFEAVPVDNAEDDWVTSFQKKRKIEREVGPEIELLEGKQLMMKKRLLLEEKMVQELKSRRGVAARCKLQASYAKLYGDTKKLNTDDMNTQKELINENTEFLEEEDVLLALKVANDDMENEIKQLNSTKVQHVTKIFYTSRTHSQLAQFLRELKRSPYVGDISVVSLGSRKGLCVNESVRKLGSNYLINERCLEMNAKGKSKNGGCCFFRTKLAMDALSDEILTEILDMEDMFKQGRAMKACPYYSVRGALPWAEVVLLPYQILLHKDMRESCLGPGALAGNVVIVDEAHNLLDTIVSTHSSFLQYDRLLSAKNQLDHYMKRYGSKFHPNNWLRLSQLSYTINRWCKYIETTYKKDRDFVSKSNGVPTSKLMNINSFLFEAQTESINFHPLISYLRCSGLVRKLSGLPTTELKHEPTKRDSQKLQLKNLLASVQARDEESVDPQKCNNDEGQTSYLSSMTDVQAFFISITEDNGDGRIVIKISPQISRCSLQFIPLNPAHHFHDIVRECRSVIVAGGTMKPVSEFSDQLFKAAGCGDHQINAFSCGHVISHTQLMLVALSRGINGRTFDFTFSQRKTPAMIEQCGLTIEKLSKLIPGGMIVFFPSYDYLSMVYDQWERSRILKQIANVKKIHREPRQSNMVEKMLSSFNSAITNSENSIGNGALLLCVVGGKMSEGINFSDDFGRCVIVVGLPYANPKDPILMEKMNYLDRSCGEGSGALYYQGMCMKAVNQSIGRAIRHRNDYASVFLFDQRYHDSKVNEQLPVWMRPSLRLDSNFSDSVVVLANFLEKNRLR